MACFFRYELANEECEVTLVADNVNKGTSSGLDGHSCACVTSFDPAPHRK